MGFNRFTKNVLNISGLPDRVQNQASALKALFDQSGVDIKAALNQLMAELEAETAAGNIGADVASVTTKTVQAILTAYEQEIADRYTKLESDTLISENTNSLVQDVDINLTTGVITVTKKDGTVETFDTAIEKVPARFEIVETNGRYALKITNVDGTSTQTDITNLMNIYTFNNSDTINFAVTGEGNEKAVVANIKANSIGLDKLSLTVVSTLEGYMNTARDSANAAKISENNAKSSENVAKASAEAAKKGEEAGRVAIQKATEAESYAHGGTGSRQGEDTDNAKYYSQIAKEAAGGDFVTPTEMEAYAQKKGTTPTYESVELSGEVIETDTLLPIESNLHINGNSEQDSRSGKNLVANIMGTTEKNGVTIIVNEDKSITLNGTSTGNIYFNLNKNSASDETGVIYFTLENGKKYTSYLKNSIQGLDFITRSNTQNTALLKIGNGKENAVQTYTGATDNECWSYLQIASGTTFNNVTVYPMILEGEYTLETAEPYEPYGVQPSPDYPSEIRSVKSKSDNLFDKNSSITTGRYLNTTGGEETSTNYGISEYIEVEPNTQYISWGTSATGNNPCLNFYDENKTFISAVKHGDKNPITYTTPSNCKYIRESVYMPEIDLFMIEKGDKPTTYQPYGYVPVEVKAEGKNLIGKEALSTPNTDTDFWGQLATNCRPLEDGWCRVSLNNTNSTSTKYANNYIKRGNIRNIKENTAYTICVEFRNVNLITTTEGYVCFSGNNNQEVWGKSFKVNLSDLKNGLKICQTTTTKTSFSSDVIYDYRGFTAFVGGEYAIFEYRVTIVEGIQTLEQIGEYVTPKTIPVPLGDIELRSTPDGTRDTFARVDGKWNKVEKITPFTITENMVVSVNLTYHPNSPLAQVDLSSLGASVFNWKSKLCLMSNYKEQIIAGTNGEHGRFSTSASKDKVQVLNKNITDLATAKTILAGETGIIKLDTPTYTPITDQALISALDELEQLILHKGYNYITATSVNGVKAQLDLFIPSTASVTEVVETEAGLDMPIPVVPNIGDVKVKIPAKNKMTLNPTTGEVKINGEKVAVFEASETDLEAGVSQLETGKLYFVYE